MQIERQRKDQVMRLFFFFQAEDGTRDGTVDWSSDVCSSDLFDAQPQRCPAGRQHLQVGASGEQVGQLVPDREDVLEVVQYEQELPLRAVRGDRLQVRLAAQIGRASCRERGRVSGVAVSVCKN